MFTKVGVLAGRIVRASTRLEDVSNLSRLYPNFSVRLAALDPIRLDPSRYIYYRNRAISALETHGPNQNGDGFPREDLKKSYASFVNVGVSIDHCENDICGIVIDSVWNPYSGVLRDDEVLPLDKAGAIEQGDIILGDYVENVHALDKKVCEDRHPGLVQAILNGDVTDTSMGVFVEKSTCSGCGNVATNEWEYCSHVPTYKGKKVSIGAGGEEKLIFEINEGLTFFEDSVILPARMGGTAGGAGADKDAHVLQALASISPVEEYTKKRILVQGADFGSSLTSPKVGEKPDAVEKAEEEHKDERKKMVEKFTKDTEKRDDKFKEDAQKSIEGTKQEGNMEQTAGKEKEPYFNDQKAPPKVEPEHDKAAEEAFHRGSVDTFASPQTRELAGKPRHITSKEGSMDVEQIRTRLAARRALRAQMKEKKAEFVGISPKVEPGHQDGAGEAKKDRGSFDFTHSNKNDQASNFRDSVNEVPSGTKVAWSSINPEIIAKAAEEAVDYFELAVKPKEEGGEGLPLDEAQEAVYEKFSALVVAKDAAEKLAKEEKKEEKKDAKEEKKDDKKEEKKESKPEGKPEEKAEGPTPPGPMTPPAVKPGMPPAAKPMPPKPMAGPGAMAPKPPMGGPMAGPAMAPKPPMAPPLPGGAVPPMGMPGPAGPMGLKPGMPPARPMPPKPMTTPIIPGRAAAIDKLSRHNFQGTGVDEDINYSNITRETPSHQGAGAATVDTSHTTAGELPGKGTSGPPTFAYEASKKQAALQALVANMQKATLNRAKAARKLARMQVQKCIISAEREDEEYENLLNLPQENFDAIEKVVEGFDPQLAKGPDRTPSLAARRLEALKQQVEDVGPKAPNMVIPIGVDQPESADTLDEIFNE